MENGCVFRDGSIILTPPAPDKPRGNKVKSRFIYNDRSYEVEFTDILLLRFKGNEIAETFSPEPFIINLTDQ